MSVGAMFAVVSTAAGAAALSEHLPNMGSAEAAKAPVPPLRSREKLGRMRPRSYCIDTYLEEYRKGRIPKGTTRRLNAWLIVALLEAFRYTVQETEAVPRAREMAALTWLGAYLSGNRKATGMI